MNNPDGATTSFRRIPVIAWVLGVVSLAALAKLLLHVASQSALPFQERHGLNAILVCAFFAVVIVVAASIAAVVGKKLNRVVCVLVATAAGTMAALLYEKTFGAIAGFIVGAIVAAGFGRVALIAVLWALAAVAAGALAGFAGFAVTDVPVDPLMIPCLIVVTICAVVMGGAVVLFVGTRVAVSARLPRLLGGGVLLLLPFMFGIWVGLSVDTLWRVRLVARGDLFGLRTTPVGLQWLSEGVFDLPTIGLSPQAREADVLRLKRFRHLTNFAASGKQFTDHGLKRVSELSSLPHLNIDSAAISGAGLVHLRDMTGLQSVRLTNTRITGDGLVHLSPKLGGLSLDGSPITDDGLRHVQHLTSLGWLQLNRTRVTDRGLEQLRPLLNVRRLWLSGTHISDAGLELLAPLTSLTHLDLSDTQITGSGLHNLKSLRSLTYLSVARSQVTDDGIRNLAMIPSLTHLDLEGTQVSEAAIEELRKALPMLRIDSPNRRTGL